ncbi:glutamate--tRNA ligase [Anaeromyxobacter sp. Fw109-5]|uniref:Glutamate--tRNA ligase n=1 Tax=Anaeromyxobacter sp. (strain Fw109-5) TaxID=404589 RepID=SYE_ANADF|nr:glutamate--tRNA ligase [Anaeromyxobacter sp. Fw109-5]A7H9S6.1 RecName: Full=Glutamate--tRNA ligase; AltName: Full=Glutamyl-tRNA synthetase; Short=GluRS [Anaeromyxobacter sp. Fw109-5]ABS25472.1 glutamyl-tRNA synthetase [Anaeromyxobacter sp. Fw109-5]
MDKPRVRFAPSPTGYLHIGGARTALFNWLWARRNGGTFVLRIEDTDRERSTQAAVDAIFDGLRWLGLDWDEGPDVGGPHGPYFQTQRLEIYKTHAEKLIREGKAYACYCTKDVLDAQRKQAEAEKRQFRYPGTCRELPYDPSRPHVIRFRVPQTGSKTFVDLVKGPIETPYEVLQDEVILRGDGVPLYNFGAVVDDVTMAINLVARGDDHVNNTARQILMYEALGYPAPRFAHLPMILGADKTRLSKRHGATSVTAYRDMGYLPEAVVNYLVRLGWSHGDQELFTRDELVRFFDFKDVGATAGVFNQDKMAWVNHEWLKKLSDEELARRALPYFQAAGLPAADDAKLRHVCAVARERARTFGEYVQQFRYFYAPVQLDPKAKDKFLTQDTRPILEAIRAGIAALEALETAALEKLFHDEAAKRGLGLGKVAQPVRVALTGGTASPGMYDVLQILGKDEALRRLDDALRIIG